MNPTLTDFGDAEHNRQFAEKLQLVFNAQHIKGVIAIATNGRGRVSVVCDQLQPQEMKALLEHVLKQHGG